jgi:hypothetical protein
MILSELRERIKKGKKDTSNNGRQKLHVSRSKKGFSKGKSGLYTDLRVRNPYLGLIILHLFFSVVTT